MSLRSLLVAVAIFAFAGPLAMATPLPYASNFGGTSNGNLPSEYTAVTTTGTGVSPVVEGNPGSPALQFAIPSSASGSNSSQAYITDNSNSIGNTPGTGFTYSATFTVPTYHLGGAGDTIAFKLIALDNLSNSDPNSSSKGYIADFNMPSNNFTNGTLTLSSLGGDFTTVTTSSAVSTSYTSNTYTVTLSGTYLAGGNLQLTGSVYDGSNTNSVTAMTTTPGLVDSGSDNVFSIRLASNNTSYATAEVSNVSLVATPEPASLGLLALGALGLLKRRGRRPAAAN